MIPYAQIAIPSKKIAEDAWLLCMMGLGMNSSDDELCYEEDEEEDVDHACPPKNNEQAGPSVPRTVTTSDSVTKKRSPAIHSFFNMPNKKLAFRSTSAFCSEAVCPFHGPARDSSFSQLLLCIRF